MWKTVREKALMASYLYMTPSEALPFSLGLEGDLELNTKDIGGKRTWIRETMIFGGCSESRTMRL
jgi:hypothetical protein